MTTRDAILKAANEAYATSGYEGLSLRIVAKAVGITPMAIYRHFADKDELMHHVVLTGLARFRGSLEMLPNRRDPWRRLADVASAYLRFALDDPQYFFVVFLATDKVGKLRELTDEGARAFSELFALLSGWVAECLGEAASPKEVQSAAIDVWSYCHGLVSLHAAGRFAFLGEDFETFHERKMRTFLANMKSESEARKKAR